MEDTNFIYLFFSVQKYGDTIKTSLLEVQDLLGSFDLSPTPKSTTAFPPRQPPAKSTQPPQKSSSAKVMKSGGFAEEVEVPLYDSDSLPSPPPSSCSSSEADPKEKDKLLDFSQDDEYTYDPNSARRAQDSTQEGFAAPRILKATLQAKHGLEVLVGLGLGAWAHRAGVGWGLGWGLGQS